MEKIKWVETRKNCYEGFIYIPKETPGIKTENVVEPGNPIWVFTDKDDFDNTQGMAEHWILENKKFFRIEYEKPEKELIKKYIAVHIEYETDSEITGENIEKALWQQYLPMNQSFRNFKVTVWRSGTVEGNKTNLDPDPLYKKKNSER